jgi:hypothetical protein
MTRLGRTGGRAADIGPSIDRASFQVALGYGRTSTGKSCLMFENNDLVQTILFGTLLIMCYFEFCVRGSFPKRDKADRELAMRSLARDAFGMTKLMKCRMLVLFAEWHAVGLIEPRAARPMRAKSMSVPDAVCHQAVASLGR